MKTATSIKTKKLIFSALMAALVCVATWLVKLPMPLGYIHLGDAPVILAAFLLSPWYGFLAAGIGSCMADLFAGYAIYAPVTFLIKGCMVLVVRGILSLWKKKQSKKQLPAQIVAAVSAELLMIFGYFLFEGFLYEFGAAATAIPFNAIQGAAGAILGLILVHALKKSRFDDLWNTFEN